MNIIAKAKPVKFHIEFGGTDCFTLDDLLEHFNVQEVRKLKKPLVEWLQRQTKNASALQIAQQLEQAPADISDLELVRIFFPQGKGESNYQYLQKYCKNKNVSDVICNAFYKKDAEIAIYGLENHLFNVCTELPPTAPPEGKGYFTGNDLDAFIKDPLRNKVVFLYAKYLCQNPQTYQNGKSWLKGLATGQEYPEAQDYLNSAEFKKLDLVDPDLQYIRAQIEAIQDSLSVKDFLVHFGTWADTNCFMSEKADKLVNFIMDVGYFIERYKKNKRNTIQGICNRIEEAGIDNSADYVQCFYGLLVLLCQDYGKSKSRKYFEASQNFPISQYVLQEWKHIRTDYFACKTANGEIRLEYWDSPENYTLFIKNYIIFTIDYLEKQS